MLLFVSEPALSLRAEQSAFRVSRVTVPLLTDHSVFKKHCPNLDKLIDGLELSGMPVA